MQHSWIEINRPRLKENIRSLRESIPSEIMFVVKADAYGHGMVSVARAAAEEGVKWFAVAYLEEALALREALPDVNVLVLGYVFPENTGVLLEKRILPIVTDLEHGLALAVAARALGETLPVHLKVDTGMGRFGVQWDAVEETVAAFDEAGGLELTGVCSHFAKVEPKDPDCACLQAGKFHKALEALPDGIFTHLSSSRAALYFPEWDFDAIRQGRIRKVVFRRSPFFSGKPALHRSKRCPPDFRSVITERTSRRPLRRSPRWRSAMLTAITVRSVIAAMC